MVIVAEVSDLTVEILTQIRDDVADVRGRMTGVEGRLGHLEQAVEIVVKGQHELALDVVRLSNAMLGVLEEIRSLRDEKYRGLEERVARLERRAG